MKTSPIAQRFALLKALDPICGDAQFIVEIYLNFDCAEEAMHNMYERYAICKNY
jgi:brefeldin A-inhibited guanine nucleotide-exchange protein